MLSYWAGVGEPQAGENMILVVGPVAAGVRPVTLYTVSFPAVLTLNRAPIVTSSGSGPLMLQVVSLEFGDAVAILAVPLGVSSRRYVVLRITSGGLGSRPWTL